MLALLANPYIRNAAIAGAAFLLLLGAIAYLRADAANDALNEATANAAKSFERIQKNADTAAGDALRNGAADRMRAGTF